MGLIADLKALFGRARETAGGGPVDALGNTEDMYRPALAGARPGLVNDLNPIDQERQRALARQQFFRNAIGGGLLDGMVSRVIGVGVQVKAADERVQAAIERFLTDPDNDLEANLPRFETERLAYGELFLPLYLTKENADVRLGYLPPDQIDEVIWKQGDAKKALGCIQKRTGLGETQGRRLWIIPHPEPAWENRYPPHPALTPQTEAGSVPGDDGLPVLLPAENGETLPQIAKLLEEQGDIHVAGYLFYHRTGALVTGRGRSIYERINDWLKGADDYVFGELRNGVLRGRYLYQCTLKGAADATRVEQKKKELGTRPPAPGTILVHNDLEEWDVLSPGVTESSGIRDMITSVLGFIGVSCGTPKHELSAEDDVNRSTAKESRSQSINRGKRNQLELAACIRAWVGYAIDQKAHAGQLPQDVDRGFEVVLPELDARDEAEVAQSVAQATAAMATAVDRELVLETDARAYLYQLMGRELPDDEEFREQLDKERQARAAAGYAEPPPALANPGQPAPGQPAGGQKP